MREEQIAKSAGYVYDCAVNHCHTRTEDRRRQNPWFIPSSGLIAASSQGGLAILGVLHFGVRSRSCSEPSAKSVYKFCVNGLRKWFLRLRFQ